MKNDQSTGHHDRRTQFIGEPRSQRRGPTTVLVGVALLFAATLIFALVRGPSSAAITSLGVVNVAAAGVDVVLDAAQFDDGQARFFHYTTASGGHVRFFVMKSSDGVVRAAFDACDECFREKRGYRQEGQVMVCNSCSQTFPSTQINVLRGGCNPSPIEREVQEGQIVLRAAVLAEGTGLF
jgi:uncharacterized membrane protein